MINFIVAAKKCTTKSKNHFEKIARKFQPKINRCDTTDERDEKTVKHEIK